jgi:hypothetical protein
MLGAGLILALGRGMFAVPSRRVRVTGRGITSLADVPTDRFAKVLHLCRCPDKWVARCVVGTGHGADVTATSTSRNRSSPDGIGLPAAAASSGVIGPLALLACGCRLPSDRQVADHRLPGDDLSGRAADGLTEAPGGGARQPLPTRRPVRGPGTGNRVVSTGYRCVTECSPWVDVRALFAAPAGYWFSQRVGLAPEESCCNVETCCCWQRPRR